MCLINSEFQIEIFNQFICHTTERIWIISDVVFVEFSHFNELEIHCKKWYTVSSFELHNYPLMLFTIEAMVDHQVNGIEATPVKALIVVVKGPREVSAGRAEFKLHSVNLHQSINTASIITSKNLIKIQEISHQFWSLWKYFLSWLLSSVIVPFYQNLNWH